VNSKFIKYVFQFIVIFLIVWGVLHFINSMNVEKAASTSVKVQDANGSTVNSVLGQLLPLLKTWGLPILVLVLLAFYLLARKNVASGIIGIGKSKAKIYFKKETGVTFKDVAGVDEAKVELIEVVEFLKNPKFYRRLGARAPKGVLLVGPPGTGKTLLARAVAGEASVPFLSINGSEFIELYVGVGAARVRDLFQEARSLAPSIIFIDELDALGRQRESMMHSNDEREHTLNQLLSEMDGFDPNLNVIILAATNRPEVLDPALLRAGRFDRQVLVDKPDKAGRIQILDIYLKKIVCAKDVDREEIATLTLGFTGADLAALVNEAALIATRRNAKAVRMEDFNYVIERIIAGFEKKNRLLSPVEREMVAYHEMGHAIVAMVLTGIDKVNKVSIIQRGGGMLGYTMQQPTEDRYIVTKEELEKKLAVMMGGQASELVEYGQVSTGSADDLLKVSRIAREMVLRYGMDNSLGHVVYEAERAQFLAGLSGQNTSDKTAQEIDVAVKKIVQQAFETAVEIIKNNQDPLEKGVQLLLQKETLAKADLVKLHVKK
jgi:cell division protease FtsH